MNAYCIFFEALMLPCLTKWNKIAFMPTHHISSLAVLFSCTLPRLRVAGKPGQLIHYSGPSPTRTQGGTEPVYYHCVRLEQIWGFWFCIVECNWVDLAWIIKCSLTIQVSVNDPFIRLPLHHCRSSWNPMSVPSNCIVYANALLNDKCI